MFPGPGPPNAVARQRAAEVRRRTSAQTPPVPTRSPLGWVVRLSGRERRRSSPQVRHRLATGSPKSSPVPRLRWVPYPSTLARANWAGSSYRGEVGWGAKRSEGCGCLLERYCASVPTKNDSRRASEWRAWFPENPSSQIIPPLPIAA